MRSPAVAPLVLAALLAAACRQSEVLPEPQITQTTSSVATTAPPAPSASASSASTAGAPTTTASVSTASAADGGSVSVLTGGSFNSASCPEHLYNRNLDILSDHTFVADDIVHPCRGECVVQWTLRRTGTWKQTGADVRLTVTKEDGPPADRKDAAPLVTHLALDPQGTLREVPATGTSACSYTRQ